MPRDPEEDTPTHVSDNTHTDFHFCYDPEVAQKPASTPLGHSLGSPGGKPTKFGHLEKGPVIELQSVPAMVHDHCRWHRDPAGATPG